MTDTTAPLTLTADQIAANIDSGRAANQANAVTGVYGISGSGKSSLADTAAERCYEQFGKITLCYAADLGGFGNKRLTLIRRGIMRVYDPRNHVNPFETMELISLGAFPVTLIDPERGFADPSVQLVLPRRLVYVMHCPNGHEVKRFEDQRVMTATTTACPTCGTMTAVANASRIEQQIVRHRMFKDVGLRIYDSMTALNDWGMQDLQEQSAKGSLPASSGGGSMLGAADALRSGRFVFGGSSVAQYGFLQNRTYGWLSNIRTIPDQAMPAIATFMVEQSKGTDESGGDLLLGPKIAGNARTAALPGWLGNLLHSSKEPQSNVSDAPMVYRLWLTNHIDPRDPRRIPYVAKHRGTPLGMPDYLEDPPGAEAWSVCSLKVFFNKLDEQLKQLEAEAAKKYPEAPGIWTGEGDGDVDEVVAVATPVASRAGGPAAGSSASPVSPAGAGVVQRAGRRRVGGSGVTAAPVTPDSPIVEQLKASLAAAERAADVPAESLPVSAVGATDAAPSDPKGTSAALPATSGQETAAQSEPAAAPKPVPNPSSELAPVPATPSTASPSPSPVTRLRRVARPPV